MLFAGVRRWLQTQLHREPYTQAHYKPIAPGVRFIFHTCLKSTGILLNRCSSNFIFEPRISAQVVHQNTDFAFITIVCVLMNMNTYTYAVYTSVYNIPPIVDIAVDGEICVWFAKAVYHINLKTINKSIPNRFVDMSRS